MTEEPATEPSPAVPAVVTVDAVCRSYQISRPPRTILDRVSFTVRSGEFVAIMGQSGAGKSTLLHIMGGLEPPDSGRVLVDGRDLYGMRDAERSAFPVSYTHLGSSAACPSLRRRSGWVR